MATIRDIAQRAGVGVATVSRVLNGSPLVRDATRQAVLDAVEALNYTPHPGARRLSIGKTLTVVVIVHYFTRPSVTERLIGAISLLAETEYDLVIRNVETPEQRDACFKSLPTTKQADGVLIISLSPRNAEEVSLLANAEVPLVLIDAQHPSLPQLSQVTVDDVAGGRVATEYLIRLGHRRIGFVGDEIDNPFGFISSRDRYYGYRHALHAAGYPVNPEYYREGEHSRLEARALAQELLALPAPPTAIIAASDTQAVGVLEAARAEGLHVPQDLSVVGYDDVEIADILGLTTIRQPLFESGERGVELLLGMFEDPQAEPVREVLPTELVVRETTAPPR